MKMKTGILVAGICAAALLLTGCSGEISNDYVTISQYKDVEVEKVEPLKTTDEQVEDYILGLRQSKAETIEIKDRAAEIGDIALIDYEGKKDGVPFEGGTDTNSALELGSGAFIPGFEDGIVGHNIGETFDIELSFPEDYQSSLELAGQEVVFTVTLHSLSCREVPELDDAFVKSVSETSDTVEEYKKEVRNSLEEENKSAAKTALGEAAWAVVLENTTVDKYPKEELQKTAARLREYYEEVAEDYKMSFEDFLQAYMNMDEDTFQAEASKEAKRRVKEAQIISLISEKEEIDLSDKAKEPMYEALAADRGFDSVESLKKAIEETGTEDEFDQEARVLLIKKWLAENCKQVEKVTEE